MEQLSLRFLNSKESLSDSISRTAGKPVDLTITDNSASLLSLRTKGNLAVLRMHWMFLNACDEVIREIAHFVKGRRGRTPLIRKFITENRNCLRKKVRAPRRTVLRTMGRLHDLKEIFESVNKAYFGNEIKSSIGWGKQESRRLVRKRTLGSYCRHTDTIRISPVLDRQTVPGYFVEFVVYHEMLHSAMKEEKKNGRRSVHPPEFRRRERLFRYYEKARAWEKRHW
ncbi:MAG TPA: SprT-like domain-containing protein [Thermodesulfovibrionales bacterium]|nr:SprT-like domain-containing protein [Thermodesulfovibrionales bacterium]